MLTRKNEQEKVWFRGERCFNADGNWYLATREGVDIGPFPDQRAAQRAIGGYLKSLREHKNAAVAAKGVGRDVWSNSNYL